jgi:hypothetical protein
MFCDKLQAVLHLSCFIDRNTPSCVDFLIRELRGTYLEPDPLKNVKPAACRFLHFVTCSAFSEAFWCYWHTHRHTMTHTDTHTNVKQWPSCVYISPHFLLFSRCFGGFCVTGCRFYDSGARKHTFQFRGTYLEPDPLANVKPVACRFLHFVTGSAFSEPFWCYWHTHRHTHTDTHRHTDTRSPCTEDSGHTQTDTHTHTDTHTQTHTHTQGLGFRV